MLIIHKYGISIDLRFKINIRIGNELEEAMDNEKSINRDKYIKIRNANLHKMNPIPVCKIPK